MDQKLTLTLMVTGATNPNQLLLRWDGREIQWRAKSSHGDSWEYGSREIVRSSMLTEVVKLLGNRFKDVESVIYSSRFKVSTMLPSVVVNDDMERAKKWFGLHNSSKDDVRVHIHHMESVDGEPVLLEERDENWEAAVTEAFPQAMAVSQAASVLSSAINASRTHKGKWVVYVDAGKRGADIVAAVDGIARYVGASQTGLTDSMLYDIVNAMHRDGLKPEDVVVNIGGEGEGELVKSMKRFFHKVEPLGEWFGLNSMST